MKLKDKVCVITGSSRGIGKAIALEFAKQGAKVVINASAMSDRANEALEEIRATGALCELVCADVSTQEGAKQLIDTAQERFERVDVLVNNAGITRDTLMLRMSEEDWDKVMEVILKGPFNCI